MKTEFIKLDPACPDETMVRRAGEILKAGGLVAFPTETVYGLGGDALNPEASRKIYAAKGRPSDNPLIVHIADMDHLYPIARRVPESALRLAEVWWPGPLTMIFEKTDLVPYETSGGLDTVAVRMPNNSIALALIAASGGYIAAPSANTSGRPSPTTAEHVLGDLDGKIEMILDGGSVRIGLESTIVDFTEEVPVILRPGYVNRDKLEAVLGEVRMDPGLTDEGATAGLRPKAPGMRYRHYAPRAALTIVEGEEDRVVAKINALVREDEARGLKCGVIAPTESAGRYEARDVKNIGSLANDKEIASHLFRVLREFDDDGVDRIYSEAFNTPRMGDAIMNRLLKAAGHQIIEA